MARRIDGGGWDDSARCRAHFEQVEFTCPGRVCKLISAHGNCKPTCRNAQPLDHPRHAGVRALRTAGSGNQEAGEQEVFVYLRQRLRLRIDSELYGDKLIDPP